MKKGDLYQTEYGLVRVQSTSKLGVRVRYISGTLKPKEANIEKGVMRGATRVREKEAS